MKKSILILLLSSGVIITRAQESSTNEKNYKNEFGIDVTGFVKQFINYNSNSTYYSPTYYLSYRRYFKSGNIRFAIGGNYLKGDNNTGINDQNQYKNISYSFNARIGWEFVNEISKRWQVFYGLDFRPEYSYTKNDMVYQNAGYANGSEIKSEIYGLAPLLGFRFKLTNRLSLLTESNFSINYQKNRQRVYYTPVSSAYPVIANPGSKKTEKIFTSFGQALSIYFVFTI